LTKTDTQHYQHELCAVAKVRQNVADLKILNMGSV